MLRINLKLLTRLNFWWFCFWQIVLTYSLLYYHIIYASNFKKKKTELEWLLRNWTGTLVSLIQVYKSPYIYTCVLYLPSCRSGRSVPAPIKGQALPLCISSLLIYLRTLLLKVVLSSKMYLPLCWIILAIIQMCFRISHLKKERK